LLRDQSWHGHKDDARRRRRTFGENEPVGVLSQQQMPLAPREYNDILVWGRAGEGAYKHTLDQ
jgi:hypothetical protein